MISLPLGSWQPSARSRACDRISPSLAPGLVPLCGAYQYMWGLGGGGESKQRDKIFKTVMRGTQAGMFKLISDLKGFPECCTRMTSSTCGKLMACLFELKITLDLFSLKMRNYFHNFNSRMI